MRRLFILATMLTWCAVSTLFSQTCDDGSAPVSQTQSLAGLESWDGYNDSDNEVLTLCGFPINGNVVGGQYEGIDLSPVGTSWCSEVRLRVGGVFLTPAVGENNAGPCVNSYSGGGPSVFQDLGINFATDASGCVDIQIFETYDDIPDAIDAAITAGSMTLYSCPEASILPIELSHFSVKPVGGNNVIDWETVSETRSAWQVIERSENGLSDWKEVGRKETQGDSGLPVKYSLNDKNPLPKSYYRLREISLDGLHQFSHVISLVRLFDEFSIQSISPMPANIESVVKFQNPEFGTVRLELFDVFGRKIMEEKGEFEAGTNSFTMDVRQLEYGMYTVVLFYTDRRESRQIIVQ